MNLKQIGGGIVLILSAASSCIGIVNDLPDVISTYYKAGPEWMANPNFWWILGHTIATAILLVFIWWPRGRRLKEPSYPAYLPPEDQYVTDYRDRLFEHTQWLGKKRQYEQFAKVVNNELEIVLPVMLQANFGKKERNQFVLAVSEARKLSNDSAILFKVAMGQLDAMLIARRNRLCAEYQSRQSSDAPAQVTAP